MKFVSYLLCLYYSLLYIRSLEIDNGVEKSPDVSCGPTSITVTFHTRNAFTGHLYTKGRFSEPGCRMDGNQSTSSQASVAVSFDTCGVRRSRSVNPRGLQMSVTVLIMFHPRFMTKIDRAYYVQCFYMEVEKSVTAELDVSMISTQSLTAQAPLPTCRYTVLDSKAGQPIRYAKVGDQVHHRWSCESEDGADSYCMVVHTCSVDDGSGNTVTLIDSDGCAEDQYLLGNLEYYGDLTVGRDAHVFKYAEKSTISFNCQILVAPKELNLPCPRPSCPLEAASESVSTSTLPPPPTWLSTRSRFRRFVSVTETVQADGSEGTYGPEDPDDQHNGAQESEDQQKREYKNESMSSVVDVETQSILVFDLDSRLDASKVAGFLGEEGTPSPNPSSEFCMPKTLFSIYAFMTAVMVSVSFLILSMLSYRRCRALRRHQLDAIILGNSSHSGTQSSAAYWRV